MDSVSTNPYWYTRFNMLERLPREVLEGVLDADQAMYNRANESLAQEIELGNRTFSLFIESLQAVHRNAGSWNDDQRFRTAAGVAEALLNSLLAMRHLLLLGYIPEARTPRRDSHERYTRMLLFARDPRSAEAFLKGRSLSQDTVNRRLAKALEGEADLERDSYLRLKR